MDQRETGKFISELRKQKGLTQKQLAEKLGISDRTVSKWETGNGMPEVSLMLPLCGELGVNVNELLSGKRLSAENYNEKAEENIMNLLKHKEKERKWWVYLILGGAGWLLVGFYIYNFYWSTVYKSAWHLPSLYPSTIIFEFAATLLFLAGTGLLGSFVRAFPYAFSGKKRDAAELFRAETALGLAAKTFLGTQVLMFVADLVILLMNFDTEPEPLWLIGHTVMGVDYLIPGIILYLLFMPIRTRLKLKISEAEKKN